MTSPIVELCDVTKDNLKQVLALRVKPDQTKFVMDNTRSMADAYVNPDRVMPRLICVAGEPVGFTLLDLVGPDHPDALDGRAVYVLWRLMIGAEHQGKGYGRAALQAVINHVKKLPDAQALTLTYVPADGNPSPLYKSVGFKPTGEVVDGEVVMRLSLV